MRSTKILRLIKLGLILTLLASSISSLPVDNGVVNQVDRKARAIFSEKSMLTNSRWAEK